MRFVKIISLVLVLCLAISNKAYASVDEKLYYGLQENFIMQTPMYSDCSDEDFNDTIGRFMCDNADIFWLFLNYRKQGESYTEPSTIFKDIRYADKSIQELESMREDLNTISDNIIRDWYDLSDYQKVFKCYKWIYDNITYKDGCADSYDVFKYHVGNCVGISLALGYMLNKLGVDTSMVENANHAWLQVNIDGNWYNCDATWDLGKEVWANFLFGTNIFKSNHTGAWTHNLATNLSYYAVQENERQSDLKKNLMVRINRKKHKVVLKYKGTKFKRIYQVEYGRSKDFSNFSVKMNRTGKFKFDKKFRFMRISVNGWEYNKVYTLRG